MDAPDDKSHPGEAEQETNPLGTRPTERGPEATDGEDAVERRPLHTLSALVPREGSEVRFTPPEPQSRGPRAAGPARGVRPPVAEQDRNWDDGREHGRRGKSRAAHLNDRK